jgi:hypothetical protein
MSIVIGFSSLAILTISQLIIIGIWIGSNNTSNKKRDQEISELKLSNTKIWEKINEMSGSLHDFDVIHLALKTQSDSLSLLTNMLAEHIKNPPICGFHLDIERGAAKRSEQIQDIKDRVFSTTTGSKGNAQ